MRQDAKALVQIYWFETFEDRDAIGRLRSLLVKEELDRVNRFRFEVHKRRFIVGRGVLRAILARQLGAQAGELQFVYGPYGKPHLINKEGADLLHFNLSNSDDMIVIALSRSAPIGIDIEKISKFDNPEFLHDVLSERDMQSLAKQDIATRGRKFAEIWTQKEALLKASGSGLSGDMEQLEAASARHFLPVINHDGSSHEATFQVRNLTVLDAFSVALAVQDIDAEPELNEIRLNEFMRDFVDD